MGAFEEKAAVKANLPPDLPHAKAAAEMQGDGAIYRSDNGKRYRLRHPRWVEVTARGTSGKKATAAKK